MTDYSDGLYELTKFIDTNTGEDNIQGILGGQHGYGHEYKNDVFEMHPFYWGDCTCHYDKARDDWEEKHNHAEDCYQTIYHEKHYKDYGGWDFSLKDGHDYDDNCIAETCAVFGIDPNQPGGAVHCTCDHDIAYYNFLQTISHSEECMVDKPNFKHYASGLEVIWYKYIGRSMESNKELTRREWNAILDECEDSVLRDIKENK